MKKVIRDGAPMGQGGAGIGPYDPTKKESFRANYFKAVQKDLSKRYGPAGMKKNPPSKRGNKIAI